jgi:hypothetical protein
VAQRPRRREAAGAGLEEVRVPTDLFISYSHKDTEFVHRLVLDLEDRGLPAWIDRGELQGGERWREEIGRGIRDSRVFLLIVSPDSVKSSYVAQELAQATQSQRPIIPILYRKTTLPTHLAAQLEGHQYLDFNRGGYERNLADLVLALAQHGVVLQQARELTPEEQARRRRELLGRPVGANWGAVFGRVPGWALAWGLGWAVFWIVLPLLLALLGNESIPEPFFVLPIGGFLGGAAGGLAAGFVTMLALRHNAGSITWKHMAPAVRIWGIVGPVGAAVAGGLATVLVNTTSGDCSGLGIGDCVGQIIADALAAVVILIIAILLYALGAVFAIGSVAGWLAVRRIRRLEPGILGRQAIWVILGWGGGAVVAAIASLAVFSALTE